MKRNIYLVVGFLLLCIPLSFYVYKLGRAFYFRHKIRELCFRTDLVNKALDGIAIDYTEYVPGKDNYLSGTLTTPVAFIDKIPKDPFSKTGGYFRYINDVKFPIPYLLISQGPDGDWDIEKYSIKTTHLAPVRIIRSDQKYDIEWQYNKEFYEKNGERIAVPLFTYWKLTTYIHTWSDIVNLMEQQSVSVYDPTNGIVSNGDIIIPIWTENIYSKYKSKLIF